MKKVITLVLATILLLLPFSHVNAYDTKAEYEAVKASLEKKYGIIIKDFEIDEDYLDRMHGLYNLQAAINDLPNGLFENVLAYKKEQGISLTINLNNADWFGPGGDSGSFVRGKRTDVINLRNLSSAYSWFAKELFHHEFAHMLHSMLDSKYGESKLRKEWDLYNKSTPYSNAGYLPEGYDTVYASTYGATSYREDFAESFVFFTYHKEEARKMYTDHTNAILLKKGTYIESLLQSQCNLKGYAFEKTRPEQLSDWAKADYEKAISTWIWGDSHLAQSNISRDEYIKLLSKAMMYLDIWDLSILYPNEDTRIKKSGPSPFKDVTGDTILNTAYYLGIIKGDSNGMFNGSSSITRQEAAVMLNNVLELANINPPLNDISNYTDYSQIGNWAKLEVANMISFNIMTGTNTTIKTFTPTGTYTFQQAYVSINRLVEVIKTNQK